MCFSVSWIYERFQDFWKNHQHFGICSNFSDKNTLLRIFNWNALEIRWKKIDLDSLLHFYKKISLVSQSGLLILLLLGSMHIYKQFFPRMKNRKFYLQENCTYLPDWFNSFIKTSNLPLGLCCPFSFNFIIIIYTQKINEIFADGQIIGR